VRPGHDTDFYGGTQSTAAGRVAKGVPMRRTDRVLAGAAASALVLLAAAAVATASRGDARPTLQVQLREMAIAVNAKSVPAGKVTFSVTNAGRVDHELVIMRAPASGRLRLAHFKAGEETSVGEVHEIAPGKTGRGTFTLKPGTYFLICNIAGHFQLGMVTELKVLRPAG
jgi:uncharacterized cupredoxin-like copper-binding protein